MLRDFIFFAILAFTKCQIVEFEPSTISSLSEETSQTVSVYYKNCTEGTTIDLEVDIVEGTLEQIGYPSSVPNVTCDGNSTIAISGKMIGFYKLRFSDKSKQLEAITYDVGVIRPPSRVQDKVFLYGVIIASTVTTLSFGVSVDLQVVKKYFKRPVAPAIGFCSQFILMPLIAFLLTLAVDLHPAIELGIFAAGVTPGGGASNIFSYMLGGDIELSITMTFISNIGSLAMLPLWMYTLGKLVIKDEDIGIPFLNMLQSLAVIIVPVAAGILINRYLPRVAKIMMKALKPICAVTIIFIITMSIWTNIYAFRMVFNNWKILICTMCLPYIGGLFGLIIGAIFKQGYSKAVTIGIETAVQNTQIPTILLRLSLDQPWADISSAIPVCLALFVPWPLLICTVIRFIKVKFCDSKTTELENKHQPLDETIDTFELSDTTKEAEKNLCEP